MEQRPPLPKHALLEYRVKLLKDLMKKEIKRLSVEQKRLKTLRSEEGLNLTRLIQINSAKITWLHHQLDANSPAGNNGKWTHDPNTLIVNTKNPEVRSYIKKHHRQITGAFLKGFF